MPKKPEAILILADSARGVYIPQHFAESIDRARVTGVSDDDWAILEREPNAASGPDPDLYWDTWARVLDNAELTDASGNVYRLHQDGDLFAVCDALLSDSEYLEFWGEPREEPRDERQAETWTITIETGNAAFDGAPASEVARILRGVAGSIEQDGGNVEYLYDINGNKCGTVTVD